MNDLLVFEAWLRKQYYALDLDLNLHTEELKLNLTYAKNFADSLELITQFRSSITHL